MYMSKEKQILLKQENLVKKFPLIQVLSINCYLEIDDEVLEELGKFQKKLEHGYHNTFFL
jgi:hypothetical protein